MTSLRLNNALAAYFHVLKKILKNEKVFLSPIKCRPLHGDYCIRSTASKVWNNLYRFSNCNLLACKNTEFKNYMIIKMIIKNQPCLSVFLFFVSLIWFAAEDFMTMDCDTVLPTLTILNMWLMFTCGKYIENFI